MDYFKQAEEIDVAAFQLRYQAVDGRQVFGVKWTEPVIDGDWQSKQGQNIRGEVYYKIIPTQQLYDRLLGHGLREIGYDDQRFLTQQELDQYIDQIGDEVQFKQDELSRLKKV